MKVSKVDLSRSPLFRRPKDMSDGIVYSTVNYGDLKIVDYINSRAVKVVFLETGTEHISRPGAIRNGTVKDKMVPNTLGVGYIGCGDFNQASDPVCYAAWRNMIRRCYCAKTQLQQPTYIGCKVDKSWHNFQVFSVWFYDNYIDGFHLDKDKLVKGNKIYGPDTCCFISLQENNNVSLPKTYTMISPEGKEVEFTNMDRFCIENGLAGSNLSAVFNGRRNHCGGWTAVKGDRK